MPPLLITAIRSRHGFTPASRYAGAARLQPISSPSASFTPAPSLPVRHMPPSFPVTCAIILQPSRSIRRHHARRLPPPPSPSDHIVTSHTLTANLFTTFDLPQCPPHHHIAPFFAVVITSHRMFFRLHAPTILPRHQCSLLAELIRRQHTALGHTRHVIIAVSPSLQHAACRLSSTSLPPPPPQTLSLPPPMW